MLNANILEKIKKEYRIFIEVTVLFSLLLAIGYAIGYWSTFSINIFPFLTLSDLIKCTAYPLLLTVPYMILQLFIFEINRFPKLPLLSKLNSNQICYILLFIMLASEIFGFWTKLLTFIFAIPTAIIIYLALQKTIEENQYRTVRILLSLGLLLFVAYDFGKYNAHTIHDNKEFSYSILELSNGKVRLKYLGYINNHYFFISSDNKHLYILNDINEITLEKFLKKNESDNPAINLT